MNKDLYTNLGGERVLRKAAVKLYGKVYEDQLLKPFFVGVDKMGMTHKMNKLLSTIFHDSNSSEISSLGFVHKRLVLKGLNDSHFDRMVKHIKDTLIELKIEEHLIDEMLLLIEKTRPTVLGSERKLA
jgi:hemoglobin